MIGPPTQRARTHQRRCRNRQSVKPINGCPIDNEDKTPLLLSPSSQLTSTTTSTSTSLLLSSSSSKLSTLSSSTASSLLSSSLSTLSSSLYLSRLGTTNDTTNTWLSYNTNEDNKSDNALEFKAATRGCCLVDTRTTPRGRRRGRARNFSIVFLLFATVTTFLAFAFTPVMGATSDSIEEKTSSTASTVVTESAIIASKTKSASDLGGSIDLLEALQLYNTTQLGVTQVPGLVRLKPAYYLQGEERNLQLSQTNFERAATLLRRVPEFTVAASLRQEEANSGTIVAFSHGNNRYLELQSSGRKDELRLHYVSRRDGAVHVEAFPFRLADGSWHKVALSISGSQVELLVDCHPLYRRLLRPGPPDTNFTLPQLQLWVGQRNAKHFLFKGALQDVKLIPGAHGYLSQCPQLDTSCPTCGQFSILQNTVEQLMHNLNELTHRLAAAEGRISKVEECECQKSCRANGTVHEDGVTWEKGCQQCSCVHGEIECRPTPCAPVSCKHPVIPTGQCCPVCLKQCLLHGVIYDHGEKVWPKQCVECDCFDGSFTCSRFDTETRCPPLPCPPSEQITVAEECCKFCPGVDYCAKGHECHTNASCINLQTTYACHCNIGFQGDGHNCHDVDECKQRGGFEGHHCNANTRCVNVAGSYTCECLPGYHRVDKFKCAELDECTTGHHSCSEHATCVNTAGSYYCVCKDGYTGNGYTCKPLCNQTCQNGGECIAPGRCSCRRGYIGNSCELDLDECASDLHRCHHSSTCFNMPGWYYCRCKSGYRSALHDSTQGTQCLDIDECNDQTIERRHTCHPTAKCVNTDGGYECACPRDDNHSEEECKLSCWYDEREIANSETFAPAGSPCRQCTCKDGVVTCRDPICDCSAPNSRRDKCCPQCDPAASCRHQELHHLVFRSGERWIYQCQTCECLYGEIDCWQMECPPVTCSNPVTEDGDCCPRCEDDPCARQTHTNITSIISSSSNPQPCSYAGIVHESGSSWQDSHDKCTTCECKDGQLCCSYDYGCAGDLGLEQRPITIGKSYSINMPGDTRITSKNIAPSKTTISTIEQQSSINIDKSPSSSSSSSAPPPPSSSSIISDVNVSDDDNEFTTKDYQPHDVESRPTGHIHIESTSPSPSSSLLSSSPSPSSSSPSSLLSTTSSKTLLPIAKRDNVENNVSIERSRSIAKNLVSIPTKTQQSIHHNQIGRHTLVALSPNKDSRKLLHTLSIAKRGNIGKSTYLAASRLVGSKEAT